MILLWLYYCLFKSIFDLDPNFTLFTYMIENYYQNIGYFIRFMIYIDYDNILSIKCNTDFKIIHKTFPIMWVKYIVKKSYPQLKYEDWKLIEHDVFSQTYKTYIDGVAHKIVF